MYTYNETTMRCSPEIAFRYASEVEKWPELLSHYRSTFFYEGNGRQGGVVEMAAVRPFPFFNWPVWWRSEMKVDEPGRRVLYTHTRGVTKGMEVEWRLVPEGESSVKVSIKHVWNEPPFGRRRIARLIGAWFVYVIAQRTLNGLRLQAELGKGRAGNE
ncbi:SRPBCC family protein [Paenibacillus sp. NPDC058071]|uniref:SRPBCC family protein n=1 Tax=Paenibacillus sp. NPDC058071 TaxID=3346326 RepID=UPI0036DA8D02